MNRLQGLLMSFVNGPCRSIAAAKEIESEILRNNLEEFAEFDNLVSMIASYRPGGGEYLYDEKNLVEACKSILDSRQWE